MQELFRKRQDDFNTVQDGMKKIKEFQATKAQMEQELRDVRLVLLCSFFFFFKSLLDVFYTNKSHELFIL